MCNHHLTLSDIKFSDSLTGFLLYLYTYYFLLQGHFCGWKIFENSLFTCKSILFCISFVVQNYNKFVSEILDTLLHRFSRRSCCYAPDMKWSEYMVLHLFICHHSQFSELFWLNLQIMSYYLVYLLILIYKMTCQDDMQITYQVLASCLLTYFHY